MNYEKIKELIYTVDTSNLMDFELKMPDGLYVRMNKTGIQNKVSMAKSTEKINTQVHNTEEVLIENGVNPVTEKTYQPMTIIPQEKVEIKEGNVISAPMVGTFYSSSSPDKPNFVKVGDTVKAGDVICIIEAMKVMNEITTKFGGTVAEILVKNEDMLEYGQPILRIV